MQKWGIFNASLLIKEQWGILALFNAYYKNLFPVIVKFCEPRLIRRRIKLQSIHCVAHK